MALRPTVNGFAILAVGLLAACSKPDLHRPHETETVLARVANQENFGDLGFLSGCQGMAFDHDFLYVSDFYNGRVLVLDKQLQGISQVGKLGQGPGELGWSGPMTISQGRIFTANVAQQSLAVFDLAGSFLDTINVPFCNFSTQFAAYDETLFLSTPRQEKTITAAGNDGQPLYIFGEPDFKDEPREQGVRNGKQLCIVETPEMPVLVAIGKSEPVIETYTLDGVLLHRENLADNPLLQARLAVGNQFRTQNPERRYNTTIILFDEICTFGQEVYLLVADQEPPFHVLQFHVTTKNLAYVGFFRISDPVAIQAMAAASEKIFYIFDAKSREIQVYQPQPRTSQAVPLNILRQDRARS